MWYRSVCKEWWTSFASVLKTTLSLCDCFFNLRSFTILYMHSGMSFEILAPVRTVVQVLFPVCKPWGDLDRWSNGYVISL